MDKTVELFFSLFGAIVTLAIIFTFLQSKNTAGIISAWGEAFSSSVRAATGR